MLQDYSKSQPRKPFYHSKLEKFIEEIPLEKPGSKKESALERIFSDKTRSLKSGVVALLDEIETRENLNTHLIDKIGEELDSHREHLLEIKMLEESYFFESIIESKKLRDEIEGKVLNLEQEKRREELECWRDLMFLKKDLMSVLREYWDLVKSGEILGS